MSNMVETYLIVALTMALLSLWKTYSGPAIAAVMSYSYPEMLLFNMVPAMLAAYVGWAMGPLANRLFLRNTRVGYRPKLKKFMQRWNRYGQVSMAFLAPVLVGIPSYTFVSKRLNQSVVKTFGLLTASILFWSGIAYFCFLLVDVGQYIPVDTMIPDSVLDRM
ncbi:hypothetical protein VIN01S_35120 [Vibrio inusitatus NBRC 102082]|uniref:Uncharacterized protein n=1 Tax=Vibrio inusitatus NBRC 102082 TaxID=1219070 RepID=A0A4Y3I0E3_9VIBR|nr:hypothetical protein [Vibrio inusitatus]GEA52708.1 hypothetical protein VIN01S_35120 [Vibrio inusitatus NBRC 102082]